MDHEVGALGDDPEVVVGDDGGDLDDDVTGVVQTRSSRDPSTPARVATLPVARWTPWGQTRRRRSARCSPRRGSSRRRSCAGASASWPSTAAPSSSRPTSSPAAAAERVRCLAVRRGPPADPTRRTSRRSTCAVTASPRLAEFLDHVDVVVTIHGYGRWGMFTSLLLGGGNRDAGGDARCRARTGAARATTSSPTWQAIPRELRGLHPDNPVNAAASRRRADRAATAVRGLGPRWADWRGEGHVPPMAALIDSLAAGRRELVAEPGRQGARRSMTQAHRPHGGSAGGRGGGSAGPARTRSRRRRGASRPRTRARHVAVAELGRGDGDAAVEVGAVGDHLALR